MATLVDEEDCRVLTMDSSTTENALQYPLVLNGRTVVVTTKVTTATVLTILLKDKDITMLFYIEYITLLYV
jgi:hypothetical protein